MGFFSKSPAAQSSDASVSVTVADSSQQDALLSVSHDQDFSEKQNEEAKDLIKNNLELMREVVERIRDDPDFAKSIYADCPRLQHLLNQHPDLRPLFEDPELVLINFEQVYRNAGGVLPGDEEQEELKKPAEPSKFAKTISCIVNHPLFKVFKFLLLIKKIINCVTGGAASMIRGFLTGCCCHADDAANAANHLNGGPDGSNGANQGANAGGGPNGTDLANGHQMSAENMANKAALNQAADRMSDPAVQEQMQALLDQNDPAALQEAIANDPQLSALQSSNPLCGHLMSSPDTMRIMVDPDNLRALGDAPDLIEQDFADPNWVAPSDPTGLVDPSSFDPTSGVSTVDPTSGLTVVDPSTGFSPVDPSGVVPSVEPPLDLTAVDPSGTVDPSSGGGVMDLSNFDTSNMLDPSSTDPTSASGNGAGTIPGVDAASGGGDQEFFQQITEHNTSSGGGHKNRSTEEGEEEGAQRGRFSGIMSNMGANLTDYVAYQMVGMGISDLTGGGDDPLSSLENAANAADTASSAADATGGAAQAFDTASNALNSNNLVYLESGMDHVENASGAIDARNAAVAGVASRSAPTNDGRARPFGEAALGNDEPEEDDKKPGRFGFVRNMAVALSTAAQANIANGLIGDFGEDLVDRWNDKKPEQVGQVGNGDVEEGVPSTETLPTETPPTETKSKGLLRSRRLDV